ncbi:13050_t:CDS:2, partial [Acaulospora colombiana]
RLVRTTPLSESQTLENFVYSNMMNALPNKCEHVHFFFKKGTEEIGRSVNYVLVNHAGHI